MGAEVGLRERKKQQTRQAIATAAFDLFTERGFDAVTVVDVARRADVSAATVFNYFPTKEDLILSRLKAFEDALLTAIREREPGQSISAAFRTFVLRPGGLLGARDPDAGDKLAAVVRIVTGSPALLARERQIYDDYTRALAGLIADEISAKPGDVEPWVVASALLGLHRALVDYVREQVLAGKRGQGLAQRVRAQAVRAVETLDRGLADYPGTAKRRHPPRQLLADRPSKTVRPGA